MSKDVVVHQLKLLIRKLFGLLYGDERSEVQIPTEVRIPCVFYGLHKFANFIGRQIVTFFDPRTSIGEISSTFYAEFRYVYRIFLSGRVSKIERTILVRNITSCKF